jgi:hypothetical protein
VHSPVVDDAGASAFPSRSNRNANLPYPTAAFDESTDFWIGGDPGLKSTIFLFT